jgi:hypothetical protein
MRSAARVVTAFYAGSLDFERPNSGVKLNCKELDVGGWWLVVGGWWFVVGGL